jgi:hypothetical protein
MFKKSIFCAFAVVALAAGSQAYAGNFSGPGTTTISPAPGAAQSCAALSNDVSVQLSNNVIAGFTCTGTSSFTASTCHSAGTNKSQTIPCTYTAVNGNPADPTEVTGYTPSASQCPARAVGEDVTPTTATFVGRVAFRGSSGGGTVGAIDLGGACTGAVVEATTTGS